MTYREAAIYANRSLIEIKTEFEDIIEAMQEIKIGKEITIQLLEFWLFGTLPVSYKINLGLLNPEDLLESQGIPREHIENALSESNPIDKYVLFKNACLHSIGEELTPDFKHLVINPIMKMYVQPTKKNKAERLEQLKKGRETIKTLGANISKTIKELNKIKPYHIAGSDVESVLIKLEQIEYTIKHQFSE